MACVEPVTYVHFFLLSLTHFGCKLPTNRKKTMPFGKEQQILWFNGHVIRPVVNMIENNVEFNEKVANESLKFKKKREYEERIQPRIQMISKSARFK